MAIAPSLIALVILALVVVGIVILTTGFRGKPVFTMPRCARCSYDLRAINFMAQDAGVCPECGASLREPGAVNFGQLRKRPRTIFLGLGLVVLPLLALMVLPFVGRRSNLGFTASSGPQRSQSLSNAALVASVATTANQPWDWQELEKRLNAGSLSTAEVDSAIGGLTTFIAKERAAGRMGRQNWSEPFVTRARAAGSISAPVLQKLCQTFYGDDPKINFRSRVRAGAPIDFLVDFHDPSNLSGMRACFALRQITAEDGSTITARSDQALPDTAAARADRLSGEHRHGNLNGKLTHALPSGEHELSFVFDIGTVSDPATFRGMDGRPGPVEKWPSPIATWQITVKKKLTVVGAADPVIDVVTDPKQNPLATMTIGVEKALARPSSRGVEIVVNWKIAGAPEIPLAYRVTLGAGSQQIEYGTLQLQKNSIQRNTSKTVKSLPSDVTAVDLILTPDPALAEQQIGVESIWGGEHKIQSVPLERADLR